MTCSLGLDGLSELGGLAIVMLITVLNTGMDISPSVNMLTLLFMFECAVHAYIYGHFVKQAIM